MKPLLSICIPCYRRITYVRNTLNSIYKDNAEISLDKYEVIISDNDSNQEVKQLIKEFPYKNLHYFPTQCEGFMNSFYALTYGNGEFLKLHNSQEMWKKGSLKQVIEDIETAYKNKDLIFYTSGLLMNGKKIMYKSFNDFMYALSYFSSWSNGFCIWKEDFDQIRDYVDLNKLFPHTSLFLTQIHKKNYWINDMPLFNTQFVKKRGGHNKFHAFSYEYPSLIDKSFQEGNIYQKTKDKIFRDIKRDYLPLLYFNVNITHRETFESEGFKNDLKYFFSKNTYYYILFMSLIAPLKALWRKFKITLL